MDPNLFHIDYERLLEVLVTIVVLSFFVERALALLFESRFFIELTSPYEVVKAIREKKKESIENLKPGKKGIKSLKELISFVVSFLVVYLVSFDALTITLASNDKITLIGMLITAAIIAGGSKGSIWLFKNLIGWMSSTEEIRQGILKPKQS